MVTDLGRSQNQTDSCDPVSKAVAYAAGRCEETDSGLRVPPGGGTLEQCMELWAAAVWYARSSALRAACF